MTTDSPHPSPRRTATPLFLWAWLVFGVLAACASPFALLFFRHLHFSVELSAEPDYTNGWSTLGPSMTWMFGSLVLTAAWWAASVCALITAVVAKRTAVRTAAILGFLPLLTALAAWPWTSTAQRELADAYMWEKASGPGTPAFGNELIMLADTLHCWIVPATALIAMAIHARMKKEQP